MCAVHAGITIQSSRDVPSPAETVDPPNKEYYKTNGSGTLETSESIPGKE